MKAAIYKGQHDVEIRELPLPELKDNDVLIQNLYSSICGTDVAVYRYGAATGHRIFENGEFGHEAVSRIVAKGENVTDFEIGERVYPYPLFATGDTRRAGTIGGFSEYILVPDAKRNHSLYSVDERISDRAACLIEPFTVGCRAAKRGQPAPGETAVIFGCGTIGIAAAIAMRYFGMEKVMLCDLSAFRLSIAKKLGFAVCCLSSDDFDSTAGQSFGEAHSLNGPVPDIDCFLDAAGSEQILDRFMQSGKIGSRLVNVAVNKNHRDLDMLHLTYSSKSIIGSGGYLPEDVGDVMDIMKSGRWDIESLITHEFPLDRIGEALETASDSDHALNVVIRMPGYSSSGTPA